MGTTYTAPSDRAAGRDGANRALSVIEADEALSERLFAMITMVRRIRRALHRAHGPDSPLHPQLEELEDAIIDLEGDADHVEILPSLALGGG